MTDFRSAMLRIVQGEVPDRPLFVPRLDIWYNRNRARGTLPPPFADRTLAEITTALGLGTHSVVPDFIRSAPESDLYHRALGFYNNPEFPYRADFDAVDFTVEKTPAELKVIYHGPRGEITTRCAFGAEVLASGVSIPDIIEPAIKSKADYPVLADILARVRIVPTPERYQAYHDRIGSTGLAVAFLSLAAGPVQHIMRDLRRYVEFCFDQIDSPDEFAVLVEVLARRYEEMIDAVLPSAAEVVLFGANYDDTITYRPFFAAHIASWLNRAADRLHAAGKRLLTHTDGENRDLLPVLRDCRFDVADSVCPAPMTRVTLREYRDAFAGKFTIWGGIPSTLMLKSICSDAEFRRYVQTQLRDCRPYDRLILSIADTTPPDAEFDRLLYLCEAVAK